MEGDICVFAPMDYPGKYYVITGVDDAPQGLIHQVSVHTESLEDAARLSASINERYGDRVKVINDDKPVIRRIDGRFYVYGTPWKGKENFGENVRVPAKALCFLSRAEQNSIGPIDTVTIISHLLNQTVRPTDKKLMSNLLGLLDGFVRQVDCYDLRVNMNPDAPEVAYEGIKKGLKNED